MGMYQWLQYANDDESPEKVCKCSAILQGEKEELQKAKLLTITKDFQKIIQIPDEYYINATQDCRKFKITRKYITIPLSKEEEEFPLAYSMVVHHKVQNFERLLRAIYTPQNIYCVHVDKKAPASVFIAINAITSCFQNVFMVSKPVNVVYAGWTRVQADLNCMADLYNTSTTWKYFINLCGQDFPLKMNSPGENGVPGNAAPSLVEFKSSFTWLEAKFDQVCLAVDEHGQRLSSLKLATEDAGQRIKELKEAYGNLPGSNSKLATKVIDLEGSSLNLPILSGNAYIVVNRGYIRSVLEDERIQALIEWAKDTYSPDEFLWATIQRMPGVSGSTWPNRKFDITDMNAIARMVKWQWHEGSEGSLQAVYPECKGHHVRSICVYGAGDLQWLTEQHHLFANKFDADRDPIAVYCLEKYLRHKALIELV
ncbi:beta-1,3-galactosyl-O-glycosyl-glycoprotein beta-1,6-N-acetylglucosaminyltransferase-like [Neolamprologus brichardi]|uniref:beta-1,3-galactosyl-O-glycosyl-glycoprotein beta-1,6-N-acetylglucosaminyltransferase-like n=1 Tax=Neolamprologus brichardi TaxID=32507 RepID=UPI001643EA5C|nr:beta-1,3-galactosyl-O-glycosyl-glycoprotein beta-1,6-N-acetylglucosaminyltransferase-like [Neolamprologus brichardi]